MTLRDVSDKERALKVSRERRAHQAIVASCSGRTDRWTETRVRAVGRQQKRQTHIMKTKSPLRSFTTPGNQALPCTTSTNDDTSTAIPISGLHPAAGAGGLGRTWALSTLCCPLLCACVFRGRGTVSDCVLLPRLKSSRARTTCMRGSTRLKPRCKLYHKAVITRTKQ